MKKLLKQVGEELVFGDHLVGLAAVGMALSVVLILNLDIKIIIIAIAYLSYLIVYTYNHLREILVDSKSNPERSAHLSSKKKLRITFFTTYLVLISVLLAFTNWSVAAISVIIILGGILYTEYFKKVPIIGFKNYFASFFWALIPFLIAFFYDARDLMPYVYLAIFIFIRVFLNTVFFDIKDIESDKEANVKTLPVFFGKKKVIYILHVINILSLVPLVIGIYMKSLPLVSIIFIALVLHGIYYLVRAMNLKDKDIRFLSYVFLDGEYMFWPIIIFIGKLFI